MTPKEQLLNELRHHTWVTIRPSSIHGNGVFALRKIPKGCREIFSNGVGEFIPVERKEIDTLPEHSKKLVETYCLFDDTYYWIPEYGFKVMDVSVYLNHSDQPNIISINDGEYFETIRDIEEGEELLIDYGTIVTSDE
ncbi:MAG: SET domain-containing protein [Bacteroidota bacterium]|jgi:SET domain-containing protein